MMSLRKTAYRESRRRHGVNTCLTLSSTLQNAAAGKFFSGSHPVFAPETGGGA